jgi:hypothetical protein
MWKCECGVNNEEESLSCINCGQERGVKEELFVEPPPAAIPRGRGFEEPTRGRGFEEPPRERGFEEVYAPPEEEFFIEEGGGPTAKKVLSIVVVSIMSLLIVIISLYAFFQIGNIKTTHFLAYISQCVGIWVRCIILTQAVVIIGIILIWLLKEPKPAKS